METRTATLPRRNAAAAACTTSADGIDLLRNTAVAIVGNMTGAVILVAFVRSARAGAQ